MYFMILGEMSSVESGKDRSRWKEELSALFETINEKYEEAIASNFTLTVGNEFQGLLKTGDLLMEILDEIRLSMGSVALFFGIGIGEIETRVTKLGVGMDGPAYWNAREAILAVKEERDYGASRILICADENRNLVRMMNEILRLCGYMESRWRETQKEVVEKSMLLHGHDLSVKQTVLAGELGLSTQALNQRIQSSGYYNYIRARKEISSLLQAEWGALK